MHGMLNGMSHSLTILLVEKNAKVKSLTVKDYHETELYKKCGFKKAEDFKLHTEWTTTLDKQKIVVQLYGKLDGKANSENKYDFPPPADNKLFFGTCALVGLKADRVPFSLSLENWDKIVEKLFGGFETLDISCRDDEDEEDELDKVPKHQKTKHGGYLKDGFVVDSSDADDDGEKDDDEDDESEEYKGKEEDTDEDEDKDDDMVLEDAGSELSEETYVTEETTTEEEE